MADLSKHECKHGTRKKFCKYCNPTKKVENMKLIKYIKDNHQGSVKAFAKANDYHITQVHRFIEKCAEYNDGKPYFKKYMNKVKSND